MYILENSIPIFTDNTEDKVFAQCENIINGIVVMMKDYDCNECMSTSTGEVITIEDLRRTIGILGGLPNISVMYSTKS